MRLNDLTGQEFDRLTVKERAGTQGRLTLWRCICKCGNITTVRRDHLVNKTIRSCGCLLIDKNIKHGHKTRERTSREYSTWRNMIQRCTNPKADAYPHYGGRGIRVCARWLKFENFLSDMGPKPLGLTLERQNTNGDYSPDNCIWATQSDQIRNRRHGK